jgi:hypothetical protein
MLICAGRGVLDMRAKTIFVASLVAAATAVSGCSTGGSNPVPSTVLSHNEMTPPNVRIIGDGYYVLDQASSVKKLVSSFDAVVVGTVVSFKDASDPPAGSAASPDTPSTAPAGSPKANQPAPVIHFPTNTRYTIEVTHVIKAKGIKSGATITVDQSGGVKDGISYESYADPLLHVGSTYLFPLLAVPTQSTYVSSPIARLEVGTDKKVHPIDAAWSGIGSNKELAGLDIDTAVAKAKAAIEQP